MSHNDQEAMILKLAGYRGYEVMIRNNYYNTSHRADWGHRQYTVVASNPSEAKQVVLDNADAILDDLLTKKQYNGRKVLGKKHALPIRPNMIGSVYDSTVSMLKPREFFTPRGVIALKLTNGKV